MLGHAGIDDRLDVMDQLLVEDEAGCGCGVLAGDGAVNRRSAWTPRERREEERQEIPGAEEQGGEFEHGVTLLLSVAASDQTSIRAD